jgi:ABC-type branched-subunit amino acid transport system substrate-binding protein
VIPSVGRHARWAALAVTALTLVAACGGNSTSNTGPVTFKGTKNVGISTALSGQSALYGHAIQQSLKLAEGEINNAGGVNGYKINVEVQDDTTAVDPAVNNTKQMILQDNVVAMIGPVTSAQCAATSPISKANKVLFIAATCNSYQLTTQPSQINPYYISVVPNTYMEGCAAGTDTGKKGTTNIYIVSPDYLFGRSETNAFVSCLKKTNPSVKIANDPSTWFVKYPHTDWSPEVAQIQAAKPTLVYSNIFAADQISFINKATQTDPAWFTKYPLVTLASVDELQTLKAQYPIGMRLYMRAPFFQLSNSKMDAFVSSYKAKYNGEYPSDWAVMDYDAIKMWAQAANAAKSFDADTVKKQIVGKSFDSLRGYKFTIRAEDQQANVGETIGTTVDSGGKYPFPILKDATNLSGNDLIMPLDLVNKLKGGQCKNDDFANCP